MPVLKILKLPGGMMFLKTRLNQAVPLALERSELISKLEELNFEYNFTRPNIDINTNRFGAGQNYNAIRTTWIEVLDRIRRAQTNAGYDADSGISFGYRLAALARVHNRWTVGVVYTKKGQKPSWGFMDSIPVHKS